MEHILAKTIIINRVIELIARDYKVTLDEARDMLYKSEIIDLIDDDETGFYGENPIYVYTLFKQRDKEVKKENKI